jgi:hypothetical protein
MYSALIVAVMAAASFRSSLDPYDCYTGTGDTYKGLMDMTKSGRSCQKWDDEKPHVSAHALGNNNYCRNPDGKEKPWCYTLDPATEWEFCDVPVCAPLSETPEQWVAPAGLKSDDAEAEGPCEPEVDETPKYVAFPIMEYGKELDPGACKNTDADKAYLIGSELQTSDSLEACGQKCLETAGAKFFTYWDTAFEDGENCGCYRQCIPTGEATEGAVNYPTTYRISLAFLQKKKKRCKTPSAKPGAPNLYHVAKVRAAHSTYTDVPAPVHAPMTTGDASKLAMKLGGLMRKLGWQDQEG